jgi:hypothetical protein
LFINAKIFNPSGESADRKTDFGAKDFFIELSVSPEYI